MCYKASKELITLDIEKIILDRKEVSSYKGFKTFASVVSYLRGRNLDPYRCIYIEKDKQFYAVYGDRGDIIVTGEYVFDFRNKSYSKTENINFNNTDRITQKRLKAIGFLSEEISEQIKLYKYEKKGNTRLELNKQDYFGYFNAFQEGLKERFIFSRAEILNALDSGLYYELCSPEYYSNNELIKKLTYIPNVMKINFTAETVYFNDGQSMWLYDFLGDLFKLPEPYRTCYLNNSKRKHSIFNSNGVYKGFNSLKDCIISCAAKGFSEDNLLIIKFLNNYYGVLYDNPNKQIVFCKDVIFYRKEGRLYKEDYASFNKPYDITKIDTNTVNKALIEKYLFYGDQEIKCFKFDSGSFNFIQINHTDYPRFINLLAEVFQKRWYSTKDLRKLNQFFNNTYKIEKMLHQNRKKGIEYINPFLQIVKLKDGSVIPFSVVVGVGYVAYRLIEPFEGMAT